MINLTTIFAVAKPVNCGKPTADNAGSCLTTFPQVAANEAQVQHGLTVLFGMLAATAVVVIFIAALNFAFAGSDADRLKRAKYTILYGIIGLIISLTAEAIVLFVVGRI